VLIMTCNVRCYGAWDEENNWEHRKDVCIQIMRSRDPDIICCQEVWHEQWRDMVPLLPDYRWFGTVDEPEGRNPVNSVFYRTDRFELVSAGAYWLSETPHLCGSRSWDSRCTRLVSWLRLLDREKQVEFRVLNTHLDHVSQPAREGQARIIVEDASAYPDDYPQLLTGDMNSGAANPAIATLKGGGWCDTWEAVHGPGDPGGTWHGFRGPEGASGKNKIDWVFARGRLAPLAAEIVRDSIDGRYPSDHYFLTADVEFA